MKISLKKAVLTSLAAAAISLMMAATWPATFTGNIPITLTGEVNMPDQVLGLVAGTGGGLSITEDTQNGVVSAAINASNATANSSPDASDLFLFIKYSDGTTQKIAKSELQSALLAGGVLIPDGTGAELPLGFTGAMQLVLKGGAAPQAVLKGNTYWDLMLGSECLPTNIPSNYSVAGFNMQCDDCNPGTSLYYPINLRAGSKVTSISVMSVEVTGSTYTYVEVGGVSWTGAYTTIEWFGPFSSSTIDNHVCGLTTPITIGEGYAKYYIKITCTGTSEMVPNTICNVGYLAYEVGQ